MEAANQSCDQIKGWFLATELAIYKLHFDKVTEKNEEHDPKTSGAPSKTLMVLGIIQ